VSPFIGERVINHSKDVLEETYDLWDYFDEKRDALERLEDYLLQLRDTKRAGNAGKVKRVPPTDRCAQSQLGGMVRKSRKGAVGQTTHTTARE
jgi:hypothetical protein